MTLVLGAATCSAENARQWSRGKGAPDWWANLTDIYWELGRQTGVRPDIGFAQASHETGHGWFGRAVTAMHHNPAGIKVVNPGADDSPDSHYRFDDWHAGIADHMHRLWRYATPASVPTPDGWRSVRPVPTHYWGQAVHVEGLSGKWAPSATYHTSIVRNVEEMATMSGFLEWLPTVLRQAGVDVYVMPGAERRTTRSSGLSPLGVVWHHTATGTNWADGHVAALLRDGRRDLAGPLAQVGIERDGTWVIVALGRANHNGYGRWGNDSIGLEFYNSGVGEAWPNAQVESGVRGTAAILAHLAKPITVVQGHRETDPRRKIDPAGLSMTEIRQRVAAAISAPQSPQSEEDDMGWTSLIHAAFDAKHPNGLTAEHKAKVWYWGDVVVGKAVRGDDPWGGYQWIKANEPDLK